jgi:beta-mannosidase
MPLRQELDWKIGYTKELGVPPDELVPAQVPGAVQLDWARAHCWPDYTYADNFKAYAWMEDVYWCYSATLNFRELSDGARLFFVSRGIDYQFQIKLNGTLLYEQEGMFTPVELDLTGKAAPGDLLEVVVFPAPKSRPEPADRSQANRSCKPAVSYGWDWHPRLVPLGIWDETYLEIRPKTHFEKAEVNYVLSEDYSAAALAATVKLSDAGCIRWSVADRHGAVVLQQSAEVSGKAVLSATLNDPELWWPAEQGNPTLYTSMFELVDDSGQVIDKRSARIGFRRVRLVMHSHQWDEPVEFPKSRSNPPITLEINGLPIFCKGSNWVNPEIFPGRITPDTYRPLVELARNAHMNLFRVWGGGIVNKESFYEQCDELGIMIWQEFPLACNNYGDFPDYLEVLDRESRSIITRLRQHACLALWCGGNELFNSWSGMTDQSLALRLLNRNCFELDPRTPFLMTSPVMGMGHGHYVFRDKQGREVYQVMPQATNTAYTEFGCPGPSPSEYLRRFIPAAELFPPKPGTAWEAHHGFNAWFQENWLQMDQLEEYFGPSPDLETLVARGEWLQCEGYKCIFEEARRQKPRCSMALNWCYNEPWPCAANNSIVNWPAEPKRAYYAVSDACRPSLASARISKFRWSEGECFDPELWLLHDGHEPLPAGRIEAFLQVGEREILLLGWDFPDLRANSNCPGPIIRFQLGSWQVDRTVLVLRVVGRPELNSSYCLRYEPKKASVAAQTPTLNV